MKKVIFVKFGGSLITDKSEEEKINIPAIENLAKQLSDALNNRKDLSVVVGTGAGSFGHIQVKKYNIQGDINTEEQKLGVARVEDSVARLNRAVVEVLIKQNIPAVTISPSSIFTLTENKVKSIFSDSLIGFLSRGFVPVIFGDMVYDQIKGATVLSTDKQFLEFVNLFINKNISVEKVVFCGLTEGVIDREGKTIEKISDTNYREIEPVFFENKYIDVTGGMKNKVKISLQIAKLGIKSYIIKGEYLKKVLTNNETTATVIE